MTKGGIYVTKDIIHLYWQMMLIRIISSDRYKKMRTGNK